ncbi:MAG: hypothetical protein ACIAQZ_07590 [Sedimentisphaeraceae bacterium JB056]
MKYLLLTILLCVNALFAVDVSWDGGGADNNWSTAANWNNDTVPADGQRVIIDIANADVLLDANTTARPTKILGPSSTVGAEMALTVEGELINNSYWYVANVAGGNGTININGGFVRTRDLTLAPDTGSIGNLNIYSGECVVYGDGSGLGLYLGNDSVTGVSNGQATVNLYGGLLEVFTLNAIGGNGCINITQGVLVLNGDQRQTVNDYITSGKISVSDEDNLIIDYDNINAGETTVYVFSLEDMINAAQPGDTILIEPGVYDDLSFDIDKSITLQATGSAEDTILNIVGNGLGIVADDIKIDGVTLSASPLGSVYLLKVGQSVDGDSYSVNNFSLTNCKLDGRDLSQAVTLFSGTANCDILHNSISQSTNGIVAYDNCSGVRIIDNDIYDNMYGVRLIGSTEFVQFLSNGIYWNSVYAIENKTLLEFNAENNFWGHESGPYHPVINSEGLGNPVSDYVNFDPFFFGTMDDRWHICPDTDINGDCRVDFNDISIIASQWLECNTPECF